MRMPTVMSHRFSEVPKVSVPRSQFDRSHGHKTTFDGGYLVPVLWDEVLPGDTIQCSMQAFARLATPIKPVMDNLYLDSHFFFVPWRLVWTNFPKFMGEQENPGDSTDFVTPKFAAFDVTTHSLSDYFGWPVIQGGSPSHTHMSLYHRAYNLVYNEWYRDQNLQDSVVVDKDDGPDAIADYVLLKRGKRHDYFTSCLPWPQKGDSVSIPLGTYAPVQSDFGIDAGGYGPGIGIPVFRNADGTAQGVMQAASSSDQPNIKVLSGAGGDWVANANIRWAEPVSSDTGTGLVADLALATAATINELRQAFAVQRLMERDARGGTRYIEKVKVHFGVTSPDARLQRPEYLGGGSTPITISPVAQTAPSPAVPTNLDAQGNLAGVGTAVVRGHGFVKSFTEHGCILGIVSVRADLTYQYGINRHFSRSTIHDFYWPELSMIGEQAVLSKEIWCADHADDETVFGYQERHAEYRHKPSQITGLFRSDISGTLDIWHLSQNFASRPTLDAAFIVESPPIDRVVAVPTEPHILFDSFFDYKCARPMPVYGVPGMDRL